MKNLSFLLLLSIFTFWGCDNDDNDKKYVLTLPDYGAETTYLGNTENPDSKTTDEYNNTYITNRISDNSQIFEFDCHSVMWNPSTTLGINSDSFAFTNTTSGNFSAVTRKGVNGKTYVIAGASGWTEAAIRFKDDENPNKKDDYLIKGMYITNSVYAYESMKNGAGYYKEKEIFGPDDYFKLIIYNLDKTQHVDFYLAQGTNLLDQWQWVDLTALGTTEGLKFEMETTKKDPANDGPMTPLYFCLDGITLID